MTVMRLCTELFPKWVKKMFKPTKEYATALFELASEKSAEKEFYDALITVEKAISAFSEYVLILSSPDIPISERECLPERVFRGKIPEEVLAFVKLLCGDGRIKQLSECVGEYKKLYGKAFSVSSALIVSAEPLTDKEKSEITGKLEKITDNTVVSEYEIDENILGGLIIRIDDKVFDGSIRAKIHEIRDVIEK